MRRVASQKGAKAKADRLFSLIIRSRGACQACGARENLQCAHIISRRFSNTRCDERNALCLCARCHHHYTDHPVSFGDLIHDMGLTADYDALLELAHKTHKVDWSLVAERLQVRWEQVNA